MKKSTRRSSLTVFAAGFAGGILIWFLSPFVVGEAEPWDANDYYAATLFIAGFLAAWACPSWWWLAPIGIFVGQIAYVLGGLAYAFAADEVRGAIFLPIGLIYAAIALVLAFMGAGVTGLVATLWNRARAKQD